MSPSKSAPKQQITLPKIIIDRVEAQAQALIRVIGEKSAEVIVVGITNRSARSHSKVADIAPTKDRTKTMKRFLEGLQSVMFLLFDDAAFRLI